MGASGQARRHKGRMGIWSVALAVAVAAGATIASAALASGPAKGYGTSGGRYTQHNLLSDQAGKADMGDRVLVNPWGLACGLTTTAWLADNGADVSTLYSGDVGG